MATVIAQAQELIQKLLDASHNGVQADTPELLALDTLEEVCKNDPRLQNLRGELDMEIYQCKGAMAETRQKLEEILQRLDTMENPICDDDDDDDNEEHESDVEWTPKDGWDCDDPDNLGTLIIEDGRLKFMGDGPAFHHFS